MREKACLWKCQGWSARRREVRGRQAGKRPAGPQASPQAPRTPRACIAGPLRRAQGGGPHSAGLLGPHLPAASLPAPFKLGRAPKGRRLGPPFRTGAAAKQTGAWPSPGRGEAPPLRRRQGSCGSALPSALPAASAAQRSRQERPLPHRAHGRLQTKGKAAGPQPAATLSPTAPSKGSGCFSRHGHAGGDQFLSC